MTRSAAAAEIERLMTLHPKGYDLALTRIERLLEALGRPQDRLPPTIHIAGTNGKGSATAFCRALLESSGRRVHVHTSPHLVDWHERYRLAGPDGGSAIVSDDVLAEALRRVGESNAGQPITVFEILTAVTFLLFSEHPADACVIEVGLGGRFDATNVIPAPACSLIMPVALDHVAWLGDRVELIAAEKAGIIKRGSPVVIGHQDHDAARAVLIDAANRAGAPVRVYGEDFVAHEEHGRMVFQNENGLHDLPLPALKGRHQLANAAAAIEAVLSAGFDLTQEATEAAMTKVSWPGRMQRLAQGRLVDLAPPGSEIWLDGGHNPHAGGVIAEALADMDDRIERPLFLIAGMIDTKDNRGFFRAFEGMARHVFTVPVRSSDAGVPNDLLASMVMETGLSAEPVDTVADALQLLAETWNSLEPAPRVLITGSLYLAGEALKENGTPPQ